jgi:hypothetical protein
MRETIRGSVRTVALAAALSMCAHFAIGQTLMVGLPPDSGVHLVQTDVAVLEMQEPRRDIDCKVTPVRPYLGFDLRLHSGYNISIPLKDLSGNEGILTTVFRVTPERGAPVYFNQHIRLPAIRDEDGGAVDLEGTYDLGEGRYHVDWLIRDSAGRVCSSYWNVEARLGPDDREVALALPPGEIRATEPEPFREEPPIERVPEGSRLRIKILVNFSPESGNSVVMRPQDIRALVSILRGLYREPSLSTFSVVAFNLRQKRVLYRQESSPRVNFEALGEAIADLQLATVDVRQLLDKSTQTDYLSELLRQELSSVDFDAVVFVSPRIPPTDALPEERLRELTGLRSRLFYMDYSLHPEATPWRDAFASVVRFFKGFQYTITRPKDLWDAVSQMVARIGENEGVARSAEALVGR